MSVAALSSLVLASHNAGKLIELEALLTPLGISVTSAASHGVDEPEETGSSFAENAILKARNTTEQTGLPALSDDSGLTVAALGGAPGIYSARWAGPEKDFGKAMEQIRSALVDAGVHPTGAQAAFVCVLALTLPGGEVKHFEGRVEGSLTYPPRGEQGFGYDPIFVPEGRSDTFGEMQPDAKHAISHRAQAFKQLVAYLKTEVMA